MKNDGVFAKSLTMTCNIKIYFCLIEENILFSRKCIFQSYYCSLNLTRPAALSKLNISRSSDKIYGSKDAGIDHEAFNFLITSKFTHYSLKIAKTEYEISSFLDMIYHKGCYLTAES